MYYYLWGYFLWKQIESNGKVACMLGLFFLFLRNIVLMMVEFWFKQSSWMQTELLSELFVALTSSWIWWTLRKSMAIRRTTSGWWLVVSITSSWMLLMYLVGWSCISTFCFLLVTVRSVGHFKLNMCIYLVKWSWIFTVLFLACYGFLLSGDLRK